MAKNKPQFEVKRRRTGQQPGDRLILRQPGRHDEVREAIVAEVGEPSEEWPNSLTLGWYVWLEHPPTWSFAPRPHPWVAAALEVGVVRDRIMDDLADRIRELGAAPPDA